MTPVIARTARPAADIMLDLYWSRTQIGFTMSVSKRSVKETTMRNLTKWKELESKMSPAARKESEDLLREHIRKMPLHELRAARRLTQQQLAQTMDMTQAAVSQLENRTDLYLSTLRNFIEAMGGSLEMHAVFPDGRVEVRLGERE
jgi:DNA-binding XRE family transcriptional regulator